MVGIPCGLEHLRGVVPMSRAVPISPFNYEGVAHYPYASIDLNSGSERALALLVLALVIHAHGL